MNKTHFCLKTTDSQSDDHISNPILNSFCSPQVCEEHPEDH